MNNMITTTNGAPTNKTSGKECLDLFTRIGNMRWEHRNRCLEDFETAYQEDKELATQVLFWARAARIGSGERKTFHTILEEIGNHNEFQKYVGDMIHPNIDIRKDDKLLKKWLHGKMVTGHHSSGTCKMGNDPLAVVDQTGSVIGAENLKVVDASIMPDCIRANTNATVMLIAERIIDLWE